MNQNESINQVGYSEMYEWKEIPTTLFGLFVQFTDDEPDMIEPFHGGHLAGVSTIQSTITSDDPDEWKYAKMCNEVGDKFLKTERLAVGIKQYDQNLEFSYISTQPWEHLVSVPNKQFDPNLKYVKRSSRKEWVRVHLLGKVIVRDNGKCEPGKYCTPYVGKKKANWGIAVPAKENDANRYYVLRRLTDNTIEIVYK